MRRWTVSALLCVLTASAFAQVQTVGDVSFAVPDGWQYQGAQGGGAMFLKQGNNFWIISVHAPMRSTGDENADFKAAWGSVVLSVPDFKNFPNYTPYTINKTVGYPGRVYDDSSASGRTYARLYTLETGKGVVPVMVLTLNRQVLDLMDHVVRAVVGSVRMAPLKASPIKNTIAVADLAGQWKTGAAVSLDFYNSSGQYERNSLTAWSAAYIIAADGTFTYKFSGLVNNRPTTDDDSGVVELGSEFVVFKGHRRTTRYRFLNLQQAIDGSTVLTTLPPHEMSQIDIGRDSEFWIRAPKK
jgi:hypothetical protein